MMNWIEVKVAESYGNRIYRYATDVERGGFFQYREAGTYDRLRTTPNPGISKEQFIALVKKIQPATKVTDSNWL